MRTLVLSFVTTLGLLVWLGPAAAGSIYDPPIERHLALTPEQRPHVERILSQSRQQFSAVLHAHGIDPVRAADLPPAGSGKWGTPGDRPPAAP
jgi:hypothetical protein